jgi:hypothetical protein
MSHRVKMMIKELEKHLNIESLCIEGASVRDSEHELLDKGILVDYQAKGSGAGIKDFINYTVDFAASGAANGR